MKKDTSWNNVATWYHDLLESGDGTYQKDVILPNITRLLGDIKNKTVLDLACGPGYFVREYARVGAKVIGIDLAPELIALGKEMMAKEKFASNVTWHVASADRIPMVTDHSVDVITIILSLQNIENMASVFRECARVLKTDGKLLLVLNHPTFRIPKQSDWGWDEQKNVQYRRVDAYLSESKVKIDMHPGKKTDDYTISFHRPLQTYAKQLSKAGFAITRLEEWISNRIGPKGKTFKALEKSRHEIPLFLFIEAKAFL